LGSRFYYYGRARTRTHLNATRMYAVLIRTATASF